MQIQPNGHLTYCTNIHPGETWAAVFESLQNALLVKQKLHCDQPFGIGLRLSAQAAQQLGTGQKLMDFKKWLNEHNCYVFTMNGFPYGNFHHQVVKDQVHAPDWTTKERVEYTNLLFDQLAILLPEGQEGGVSTSPISYRFWFKKKKDFKKALEKGAKNLMKVVAHLMQIKAQTGKSLHLDIEPEPDGVLENSIEFFNFYEKYLLKKGVKQLVKKWGYAPEEAAQGILEHLQLCFDVCHFAVEYEDSQQVIEQLAEKGIKIGKMQISAAIKTPLDHAEQEIEKIKAALLPYNESTYLHQTVFATKSGTTAHYTDLGPALEVIDNQDFTELRTHFHVPIFTDSYGALQSTQDEIVKVLNLWKKAPFTNHLEVETYTWDVLPENNQLELTDSIARELDWVRQTLK